MILIIDRQMVIRYKDTGYDETIHQILVNKIEELLSQ